MRAWLCCFFAHRWQYVFCIFSTGIWQCDRCRTIGTGRIPDMAEDVSISTGRK